MVKNKENKIKILAAYILIRTAIATNHLMMMLTMNLDNSIRDRYKKKRKKKKKKIPFLNNDPLLFAKCKLLHEFFFISSYKINHCIYSLSFIFAKYNIVMSLGVDVSQKQRKIYKNIALIK